MGNVQGKRILVREKSMKSRGKIFQTKSGSCYNTDFDIKQSCCGSQFVLPWNLEMVIFL